MQNSIKIVLLILSFCLCSSSQTLAQKFGYLNYNNLIVELAETKKADSELEALREQLAKQLEQKINDLNAKAGKYQGEVDDVSPKENQARQIELQEQQQKIAKEEQEMTKKLQDKRVELYKPIFDKVNKAITEVGKENGYTFIFNESTGALLFNIEADDVAPLVKAKLGLKS